VAVDSFVLKVPSLTAAIALRGTWWDCFCLIGGITQPPFALRSKGCSRYAPWLRQAQPERTGGEYICATSLLIRPFVVSTPVHGWACRSPSTSLSWACRRAQGDRFKLHRLGTI